VATVVVPVSDQDAALDFYVGILGMRLVNDFAYPSGERWLEVSSAEGGANLCLVAARPERPAGIETGVVLFSTDLLADLDTLRAQDVATDDRPLPRARSCGGAALRWPGSRAVPACGIATATRSSSSPRPEPAS
jgi:catechol 2,3-dioxygenase-like lactoylglutathione lyase family enzyme